MAEESPSSAADRRGTRRNTAIGLAVVALAAAVVVFLAVLAADEGVLVVRPDDPAVVDVEEGQALTVTGTVAEFEFDDAFGEEDEFSEYDEGTHVIVADLVQPVSEDAAQETESITLEDIADEQDDELVGEQVTVVAEVEEDDVGLRSFVVGETD